MYILFKYTCHVGVILPDGSLTTLVIKRGERLRAVSASYITADDCIQRDYELEDGTLLLNVPTEAIHVEAEYAA